MRGGAADAAIRCRESDWIAAPLCGSGILTPSSWPASRLHPRAALFKPVRDNRTGELDKATTADGVYRVVVAYLHTQRTYPRRSVP